MAGFLQQVVSGLASGGIYASLALAIVLIYRATRVVNFAQGEMAMLTTFVAWSLMNHMPYWPAFFLTLGIAFALGVAVELLAIWPLRDAPAITAVIVTIGLLIGINGVARLGWATDPKSMESPFPANPVRVAGVAVSWQDIGIVAVSVGIVVLLWAFFQFTKLGLALRAAALNPESSRLVGVRVGWMLALAWGVAAVLGAVAGMMAAPPLGSFDQNMMAPILLYALAAAVVGGLDSPVGAVFGGLALGVVLNLVQSAPDWLPDSIGGQVGFLDAELRLPIAFLIILGALLVRPAGLFGRQAVRRV